MQISNNYLKSLFFLTLFFSIMSCKSDYIIDSPNKETFNTNKLKTLVIRPGINMVAVEGVIDDPNVTEVKIYWNNKLDSLTIPVVSKDTFLTQIDNLEEKLYIFEVQMVNDKGATSKIVSAGAKVYGDVYLEQIKNRSVVSSKLDDNNLKFSFNPLTLNTGILGTEIIYTNTADEETTLFKSTNKTEVIIPDFKSGSTLKYRSSFRYSPLALDTIYTEYTTHKPFILPKLQNSSAPYELAEYDGKRWGNLGAPWVTNEAVKNHSGFGGSDKNVFNIESGWGAPEVTNGKIYQSIELDPATYQLKVTMSETNLNDTDDGGSYIVIADGVGLPDVENIAAATEVLGYERINGAKVYSVQFTVDVTSNISFGELTTQSAVGRYGKITSWELVHVQ